MFHGPLHSPLGRRLLAAFLFVALSSVAVLTAAALVGTAHGLTSAQQSDRREAAARSAEAVAVAYQQAGGWAGADLSGASAIAGAAGARLIVQDDDDQMVWPGRGMGPGMSGMRAAATVAVVEAPVVAGGQTVGTVRLAFTTTATAGQAVAWSWVLGAAAVALFTALVAAGYVTRRLTRPCRPSPGPRAGSPPGNPAPGRAPQRRVRRPGDRRHRPRHPRRRTPPRLRTALARSPGPDRRRHRDRPRRRP